MFWDLRKRRNGTIFLFGSVIRKVFSVVIKDADIISSFLTCFRTSLAVKMLKQVQHDVKTVKSILFL